MASEKAIYWIAVGLMAVSLENHFAGRHDGQCLADRSLAAVQRLSGETSHFMAMAGVMLSRTSLPLVRTQTEVARIQNRLVTVDTVVAREQAACARLQVKRARLIELQQLQQIHLKAVCPRQALQLSGPRLAPVPGDGTI
ncbi:MAG: hypothetical protein WB952_06785 [Terriglobales bacterium]